MEEDILNYLPTFMFRGTPCIIPNKQTRYISSIISSLFSIRYPRGDLFQPETDCFKPETTESWFSGSWMNKCSFYSTQVWVMSCVTTFIISRQKSLTWVRGREEGDCVERRNIFLSKYLYFIVSIWYLANIFEKPPTIIY